MSEHQLKLVVVRGGPTNRPEYHLTHTVVSIGRSHRNAIVLNDSKVSRFHAEIVRTETDYLLRDLESANGVKVNGARCTEKALTVQDLVTIGDTDFRVERLSPQEAMIGTPVDPPTPVIGSESPTRLTPVLRPPPDFRAPDPETLRSHDSLAATIDPLAPPVSPPTVVPSGEVPSNGHATPPTGIAAVPGRALERTDRHDRPVERVPDRIAERPAERVERLPERAEPPVSAAPRLLEPLRVGRPELAGLDALAAWLARRALAFDAASSALQLTEPSAIALVGAAGTGKSAAARYAASRWGQPLFRLNLAYLVLAPRASWTALLAEALGTVGASGPAVLVIPDLDRSQARFESMGDEVRGAWRLALELLAYWVRTKPPVPFTIVSARDPCALPDLFAKGGSVDEVWHLDLPNPRERFQAIEQALRARGRRADTLDARLVGEATDGFTIAEVLEGLQETLFDLGAVPRDPSTAELVDTFRRIKPATTPDEIERLRAWAQAHARPARR